MITIHELYFFSEAGFFSFYGPRNIAFLQKFAPLQFARKCSFLSPRPALSRFFAKQLLSNVRS